MKLAFSILVFISTAVVANAAIVAMNEIGLDGDTPHILGNNFGEDSLTFSDRTHEHNGAAFDGGGLLSTSGTNIVPLPNYLLGGEYIRFANNARDNVPYFAAALADRPTNWYLLVDNRLNGPAGNTSSPNNSDPVLGGTLQWVSDFGWTRVNTGISPNGQADYTGVDEGGNAVGPGQGLNQFYSVYTLPGSPLAANVNSNGIGGSNMISLVAVEAIPEPSSIGLLALGMLAFMRRRRA